MLDIFGKFGYNKINEREVIKMTEIREKVYDKIEMDYEIRNLRKLGYVRTQNCFWFETWEKENNRVILERDF